MAKHKSIFVELHAACRSFAEQEEDTRRHPGSLGDSAGEDLKEACRAALRYAQKQNAYVEESSGQLAAVHAWQALVEVTFTRRCAYPCYHLFSWVATHALLCKISSTS